MRKKSTSQLNRSLIIFGQQPPPIGGVTRHIQRLHEHLLADNIAHRIIGKNILTWLLPIYQAEVIHIHFSNPLAQYALATLGKMLGKPTIMTVHRDIDRYSGTKKRLHDIAIKSVSKPLVLNQRSYEIATVLHTKTEKISAFLPPVNSEELPKPIKKKLENLKARFKVVCCTNAFDYALDQEGREIYQISQLVKYWQNIPGHALIVSDPTAHNLEYLQREGIYIPDGILFIAEPHDFIPVIRASDVFIRCTTTDGDSISVKEALYLHTPVLATSCTDRPAECHLFDVHDLATLKNLLEEIDLSPDQMQGPENAYHRLKEIYQEYGLQ